MSILRSVGRHLFNVLHASNDEDPWETKVAVYVRCDGCGKEIRVERVERDPLTLPDGWFTAVASHMAIDSAGAVHYCPACSCLRNERTST